MLSKGHPPPAIGQVIVRISQLHLHQKASTLKAAFGPYIPGCGWLEKQDASLCSFLRWETLALTIISTRGPFALSLAAGSLRN